ncbi:EI24 domain-containing protein [Rubellimicrobium rubrum]|uniref:EI24 domain-containing protein n=1 Tax=Rubellimicrobium rubrum TaxID=2585369 RepID=UPI00159BE778|nr:EI24 domain-containing protein [Rubellimicrobium rubrum]
MIRDVTLAVGQLPDRRFQRVLWRGVALALLLLAAASAGLLWFLAWALPDTFTLPFVGEVTWLDNLAGWAAVPVVLVLSVFLMVPVASAMTSIFLDEVAEAVEDRHYPGLPRVRPQGWGEALRESVGAFAVVLVANALALVAYLLLAPLAPVIFVVLNGFLLGREYFRVAALRREGRAGADALLRAHRGKVWLLGGLMAIPLFVPILNLIVPTLGAAAFTHLYHRVRRR